MKHILVIEDEKPVRLNIMKILEFEGFQVSGAENGEEGVKQAKKLSPDLVLCDIMMPIMDGYEVQSELQQDPSTKTVPFVFLTAKADRSDMRLAMNLGADDYLTKPFTRDELLQAICSRLDKKEILEQQFQDRLDELKGNISHSLPAELFIPLQQIRNCLETVKTTPGVVLPNQELKDSLAVSLELTTQLERLLQNFLLYALLEVTGKSPAQIRVFCGTGISDTSKVIREIAQEKAKEYNRAADLKISTVEANVQILEANFAKILEELLDNAFKFSDPDSPITLKSIINGNSLNIEICDRGWDFADDAQQQLAQKFDLPQKLSGYGGEGMGFAIAQKLTEMHNGKLTLEREASLTKVTIELPVAQKASAQSNVAAVAV